MAKDYYQILGVSQNASQEQIKKAYIAKKPRSSEMEIRVRQYLRVELFDFHLSLNWNIARRLPAKAIKAALAVIILNIVF